MKTRSLRTAGDLVKAGEDLLRLADNLPLVLTISKGAKLRSTVQNARYWASLDHYLETLNVVIAEVSDYTGHTPMEVRKLIAVELPIEYHGIVFARRPEVIHDQLKSIYNIPTSTKLGTKEFAHLEERMEQTIAEIEGEVKAIAGGMV